MSEEDTKILISSPRACDESESLPSEDTNRLEEKWSEDNEYFFEKIINICLDKSNKHDLCSHKNKKRYIYFSIPTITLPLILANTSALLPNTMVPIEPICLTLVGIISGLQTIFNFSRKKEIHNTASGKYAQLALDIKTQLARKKRHRVAFDVFLERITQRLRELDENAPML